MKVERCPSCKRRITRNNEQNRRLWALNFAVAEKLKPQGKMYSADQWHTYFKSRFLGCDETLLPGGKQIIIPRSTADLDVAEFGDYMDKVEAWANEHGCYLEDMESAA